MQTLHTLRESSIGPGDDGKSAILCVDAYGLGEEIGVETDLVVTRVDQELFEELRFDYASQPRVLTVVLEDLIGAPLASAQMSLPPRVTIEKRDMWMRCPSHVWQAA